MTENGIPLSFADIEPKMKVKGVVKRLTLAGALIDIGMEQDALLHVSQIKRGPVNKAGDHLGEGQEVTVWVHSVDAELGRVHLTMLKPPDVSWEDLAEGQVYRGRVVRIEKFGVFVDIGAERPGLVHISELAKDYVSKPSEVVQKGDEVEVKVIGVNRRKNQIDLSMKALATTTSVKNTAQEQEEELPTAMALAFQRAMADGNDAAADMLDVGEEEEQQRRTEQEDILRRTLEQHSSN